MRVFGTFLAVVVLSVLAPTFAQAQNRNFDPAQFKQMRLDRIKEQLSPTDDEWKVLQPKIEKVMDAETAGRNFGGRRRGGDNADAPPPTPTAKAQQELRDLLKNKDASADEIKAKLTALREARAKTKADLEAARKDLKEVLTQRQEAVLVTNGMLE
jgi:Spy/CpxP family protein refolding chaperone